MVLSVISRPIDSLFSSDSPFLKAGDFVRSRPTAANRGKPTSSLYIALENATFDITSEDAFRLSFQRRAGMDTIKPGDRLRALPAMGVIKAIDYSKEMATVTVWKRGDEFCLDDRPDEQYSLKRLVKISQVEFNKDCKRPYMMHKQTKLMTDVEEAKDGSVPLSLIVYQNTIVSGLLDRTEQRGRCKSLMGDGDVDPYGNIYDELKKITDDMGLSHARRPPKKGTTTRKPALRLNLSDLSQPGSPSSSNPPKASENHWTGLNSFTLDPLAPIGRRAPGGKTKIGRLLSSMAESSRQTVRTQLMEQIGKSSGFRSGGPPTPSSADTISGSHRAPFHGEASTAAEHEILEALRPMASFYVVDAVQPGGKLTVSSSNPPEVSFTAALEGIHIPPPTKSKGNTGAFHPRQALEELLHGKRVAGVPLGCDSRGNLRLNVMLEDCWIQRKVVALGIGRVAVDAVDQVLKPSGQSPPCCGLDAKSISLLLWHQEQAKKGHKGLWQATPPLASSGALSSHS